MAQRHLATIAVSLLFLFSAHAYAACSNPAGAEADIMYNGDFHVLQFCNDTNWLQVGCSGSGGSGCTGPTGTEGEMLYNADNHVLQFCNGTNWAAIGSSGGACNSGGGGCGVSNANLAGYWKLDDGTGTSPLDSSGNANNGTFNSAPNWTTGKVGPYALSLDGVDDSVLLPDMGTVEAYPFSFTAWFQSTSSDTEMTIVSQEASASQTRRVQLYGTSTANSICWNVRNGASEAEICTNYSPGSWHFAAGVSASATNHKLYVDGALFASSSTNVPAPSVNQATIGNWRHPSGCSGGGCAWNGQIDEVRIYNRTLSDSEVALLYNNGAGCAD